LTFKNYFRIIIKEGGRFVFFDTDELLKKKEVATILKVTTRQIDYLITDKAFPIIRIGRGHGGVRILKSELETYIERKKSDTTKTD
jgi:predicted DNA-binding transcriptional regulator AlpA